MHRVKCINIYLIRLMSYIQSMAKTNKIIFILVFLLLIHIMISITCLLNLITISALDIAGKELL